VWHKLWWHFCEIYVKFQMLAKDAGRRPACYYSNTNVIRIYTKTVSQKRFFVKKNTQENTFMGSSAAFEECRVRSNKIIDLDDHRRSK
jgi:hypothetical protein